MSQSGCIPLLSGVLRTPTEIVVCKLCVDIAILLPVVYIVIRMANVAAVESRISEIEIGCHRSCIGNALPDDMLNSCVGMVGQTPLAITA